MATELMMKIDIAPEQTRYAEWLRWVGWSGLALLVGAFLVYVLGVFEPLIPHHRLPELWVHPAQHVHQLTGQTPGWGWIKLLHRSDILNLLGIALLAGGSVIPLLAITPIYLRRKDRVFALLCILQVAVLVLAASGVVHAGH